MPLSKKRKTGDQLPAASDADRPVLAKKRGPSPVWLAPAMLTLFGIGLLWIVVYYLGGSDVPLIGELGGVNLLIGFGFVIAGFALATQWR